jgi:hypothetical protein
MKRVIGISLLLLLNIGYAAQTVYQWTDEQGNAVFSDKPHPDAKQIEVAPLPSFNPGQVPVAKDKGTGSSVGTSKVTYETLQLITPNNEENIWSNPGTVSIGVTLNPKLVPGDKLVILVDGKEKQTSISDTHFEISDLERGTHTVQAQVRDSGGKIVKTSNTVTIYMHKASVNQPSRGEANPVIIQQKVG